MDFTGEDMFKRKSNGLEFSCGKYLIKFLDKGKVAQVNKANDIWIHCFMNIITRLSNNNCMKEISDEHKSSFCTNLGRVFYEIGSKGSQSIFIYPPNSLLNQKDNIETKKIKWKKAMEFYHKYDPLSLNSTTSSNSTTEKNVMKKYSNYWKKEK